jgi:hypothetical protein
MGTVNIIGLLDDLRGILVRSIQAQEYQEHESTMGKKLLTTLAAASDSHL